jgi:signal peptidase I
MSEDKRGVAARIRVAALNILAPGAGLLRLGEGRLAAGFLLAPLACLALLVLLFAVLPELSFGGLFVLGSLAVLVALGAVIGSIAFTWMRSARRHEPRPLYARWYMVVAAMIGFTVAGNLLASAGHLFYKPFYLPSEAMAPSLLKNDRIVAAMGAPSRFRRGEVILFRVGPNVYIKRIAGLPGDRIAVKGGIVVLNGVAVPQSFERNEPEASADGSPVRRLREAFPGESGSHEIYDDGVSMEDDYVETLVGPGHLFVLGDNRDNSADSRVPRSEFGVEQLPIADIVGRALYYTWGPSHRSGQRINPQ